MSVYKRQGRATYSYDFRIKGARFSGDTGAKTKREAQAFERAEKARARESLIDPKTPLTFGEAATLYWVEIAQHSRTAGEWARYFAWLQENLGNSKKISEIDGRTVSSLMATRKAEGVSNSTVNRTVLEPLRAVLRRAQAAWDAEVKHIDWRSLKQREPAERHRIMSHDEEARFFEVLRPDYHPLFQFALMTGARLNEICSLEWRDIDWRGRTIYLRVTKGDRPRHVPLSDGLIELLKPLPRADAKVFTYQAMRTRRYARGSFQPIQYESVKITHKRTCAKAGIEGLRFHDLRHTFASRFVSATGMQMHVAIILGHSRRGVTDRYVHISNEDLLRAMHIAESTTQNATATAIKRDKVLK